MNREQSKPVVLYFGRHKGQPLDTVPSDYLCWALRTVKLSSGLRQAVASELQRRGLTPPAPPPPKPVPPCGRCGSDEPPKLSWHQIRDGRRQIRKECLRCGTWQGHAPQTPENIAEADRDASPAPLLDALLLAEAEGVELISDGTGVTFANDGWRRASDRLKDVVRQQSHLLAGLLLKGRSSL